MIDLAAIRPDEWNMALFIHVFSAFTLVGALVMAGVYLHGASRDGSIALTRLGYRSLLLGVLPAFIAMRVSAQWIASKEGVDDADLTWVEIGYASTDIGALALIAALIASAVAVRGGGGGRGTRIAAGLVALLAVLNLVVIWVMATKPA